MAGSKLSIYLPDDLAGEVAARGGSEGERSVTIAEMLNRYLYLLGAARSFIRPRFSRGEVSLITDALNGTAFRDPRTIKLLPYEIEDALPELAPKREVDGPALVEKLKRLDILEIHALVDAVERWWERVGRGEQPGWDEVLK